MLWLLVLTLTLYSFNLSFPVSRIALPVLDNVLFLMGLPAAFAFCERETSVKSSVWHLDPELKRMNCTAFSGIFYLPSPWAIWWIFFSKANTIQLDPTLFINQPPKRNKYNQNHSWSQGHSLAPGKFILSMFALSWSCKTFQPKRVSGECLVIFIQNSHLLKEASESNSTCRPFFPSLHIYYHWGAQAKISCAKLLLTICPVAFTLKCNNSLTPGHPMPPADVPPWCHQESPLTYFQFLFSVPFVKCTIWALMAYF